jgi:hypothetical protein
MAKLISITLSSLVGAFLAATAVWGVVSSSTAAPEQNPVSTQIVDYGNR